MTVVAAGIGLTIRWWTAPYAMTGTYSNGIRAWEQWECRTVMMRIEHFKTVRYYPNGQTMMIADFDQDMQFWTPQGKRTDGRTAWNLWSEARLPDTHDQSERPYEWLLSWWNGS